MDFDDKKAKTESWRRFKVGDHKLVNRVKKIEESVSQHADQFLVKKLSLIKEIRKMVLLWLSLILLLLLLVITNTYLMRARYFAPAPAHHNYFEGLVGEIETLNPIYARYQAEKSIERLIFSSLYRYDKAGKLKTDLAKAISISDDKKVYQVTLRDDIKWQDGKKITARDVKYTVNLFKNKGINSFTGQAFRGISVKVLSESVIEFKLRSPYVSFPHLLTFSILPRHILINDAQKLTESEFNYFPVGSGPFMVDDFIINNQVDAGQPTATVILVKNPLYPTGRLDKIEVSVFKDDQDLAKALTEGRISGALFDNKLLADVNLSEYQTKRYKVSSGVFAFFNLERDSFKSKDSRLAIRSIVDLEKIRQEYQSRYQSKMDFDYPLMSDYLSSDSFSPPAKLSEQQIEDVLKKAKLVRADGKWQLDGKPFGLRVISIKNSNYQLAAELLTQNLRNYGIEAKLVLIDAEEDQERLNKEVFQKKNYDILVYELNLGASPDVYSFWHSSQVGQYGLNFSNYKNKLVDELLSSARSVSDPKLQRAKYEKFTELWLKDLPAIGLYQNVLDYVIRDSAKTAADGNLVDSDNRYWNAENWSSDLNGVYKTP